MSQNNPSPLFEIAAQITRDHAKLVYGIDLLPVAPAPAPELGGAHWGPKPVALKFTYEAEYDYLQPYYKGQRLGSIRFDTQCVITIFAFGGIEVEPILQRIFYAAYTPEDLCIEILRHLGTYAAIRDLENGAEQ